MPFTLPDYDNPPLGEVVIGVQFEPLKQFSASHLGLYWARIKHEYPKCEDNAPLLHQKEVFEGPKPIRNEQRIVISGGKIPRNWFISKDERQLIQLQSDQFYRNWRRLNTEDIYPRFSELFAAFRTEWDGFKEFVAKEGLGKIVVDQCDLTYINHINKGNAWSSPGDLSNLFPFLGSANPRSFQLTPEMTTWSAKYKLNDGVSRLHIDIEPVLKGHEMTLAISMALKVRGLPKDLSDTGLFSWFEKAHDCIVLVFDELTSPSAHSEWKKRI